MNRRAEGNRTTDLLIANQGQNLAVQGDFGKASVAADMLKCTPAELSTFGMFLYELRDRQLWTLDTDRPMVSVGVGISGASRRFALLRARSLTGDPQ